MKANAKKRRSSSVSNQRQQSASTGKAIRLSNIEVSEFMIQHNIRDETQLMTIAKQRQAEGEKDLYMFILNKSPRCLSELIDRTWKIHDAPAELAWQEVPRMTVLTEKAKEGCAVGSGSLV